MRGDLQKVEEDTYAPVVAFSTVRLFLVLTLALDWHTTTMDWSNAFAQAQGLSTVLLELAPKVGDEPGTASLVGVISIVIAGTKSRRIYGDRISYRISQESHDISTEFCLFQMKNIRIESSRFALQIRNSKFSYRTIIC